MTPAELAAKEAQQEAEAAAAEAAKKGGSTNPNRFRTSEEFRPSSEKKARNARRADNQIGGLIEEVLSGESSRASLVRQVPFLFASF